MCVFSPLAFPLRRPRVRPGRGGHRFHEALDQLVVVVAADAVRRVPCNVRTYGVNISRDKRYGGD